MKIIDMHCHIGKDIDVEVTCRGLIKIMNKYKVDMAVISPLGKGLIHEFKQFNQQIVRCVKENKDRLVGFCSVNPWFENAVQELEKRIVKDKCKGLVLHPAKQGFHISSPLIYPLMEECQSLEIPIYFHTGTSIYDLPLDLSLLAAKFPKTIMIMGQMGTSDYWMDVEPAAELASNLTVETSVNPNIALIQKLVKSIGAERIVFGSGVPFTDLEYEIKKIELCNFTDREQELIMFQNASHLLGVR